MGGKQIWWEGLHEGVRPDRQDCLCYSALTIAYESEFPPAAHSVFLAGALKKIYIFKQTIFWSSFRKVQRVPIHLCPARAVDLFQAVRLHCRHWAAFLALCTLWAWIRVCDDVYPPLKAHARSVTALNVPRAPPVAPCPPALATTELFTVSIVRLSQTVTGLESHCRFRLPSCT